MRTLAEDGYCTRCGVPDAFCWCPEVAACRECDGLGSCSCSALGTNGHECRECDGHGWVQ